MDQFQQLEDMRIAIRNRYFVGFGIGVGISVLLGVALPFPFPLFGLVIGIILTVIIISLINGRKSRDYVQTFKEQMVAKTFQQCFQQVEWNFEKGYPKDYIKNTELIMIGNQYRSDDWIGGTYEGVKFSRSDVYSADETTDSEGNTHTTVYFEGRWMVFQFPKHMVNDLQIIAKKFGYAQKKKGIFTKKSERRHKVEMENMTFNSQFTVLAQQDQDAFYILTPSMMERIQNYCLQLDGKVMLGLIDNYLHVAINNRKNAMEPRILRANNYQKIYDEVMYEVRLIQETVHCFRLSQEAYQGN